MHCCKHFCAGGDSGLRVPQGGTLEALSRDESLLNIIVEDLIVCKQVFRKKFIVKVFIGL